MATTKQDIRRWLMESKKKGATHMIVVCDTFSYEDYPVDVMPGESAKTKVGEYENKEMQRVMEVYSHALDHEAQIAEAGTYHVD